MSYNKGISTRDIVRFLSDKNSYKDITDFVEVKETHMSYVFLTDKYVYKMKKPVAYSFLDFSTLEKRQFFCESEISLNKRLAPDVYLKVIPLMLDTNGSLMIEGEGTVVEYLVKMKRLPNENMLDQKIVQGIITAEEVETLAKILVTFYKKARKINMPEEEYFNKLKSFLIQNLEELRHNSFNIDQSLLEYLLKEQMQFLLNKQQIIKERAHKIVEAHGDLSPEHICLTSPPVIIDALEFNYEFRCLDPVEELSYFSMECEMSGAEWIGNTVLIIYRNVSGDTRGKIVESFYKSIRTTLRALSCFRHILEDETKDKEKWKFKGLNYLMLAKYYIEPSVNA